VRLGRQTLSYRELDARARRLAVELIARGVAPGDVVGLAFERVPELMIALLGILHAGGAYLPLDPSYPEERLRFMVEDSGVVALVTRGALRERLSIPPERVLDLDDWRSDAVREVPDPVSAAEMGDLAYVIYTSGSTRRPKGTGITHAGLANLLHWYLELLRPEAQDVTLLITALSFDLTQKNLLAPLLVGATLCLAPSGAYDPELIRRLIAEHGATWINCTPSAFYPLVEPGSGARAGPSSPRCVMWSSAASPSSSIGWRPGSTHPIAGPGWSTSTARPNTLTWFPGTSLRATRRHAWTACRSVCRGSCTSAASGSPRAT
jgi:non-ribosomal peptide synthetase component F